jgi:GNAT superfamily N-acetyltransferase
MIRFGFTSLSYKTNHPAARPETSRILEVPVHCRRVAPTEAEAIAPALAALHEDAFHAGMALGMLESIGRDGLERSYREAVAALDDRDRALLVAETDGEILAMAQLARSGAMNANHRAEVQRVGVADAVRGRGVGRALMACIEITAIELDITLLWLTTHEGSEACPFYEALGYTKFGVMPAYSRRPDGTLSPGAFYYKELR